jgi:3'(2'), 5'-bisphosphate nucleotidase
MNNDQLKKINYALIDTFLLAGARSIELRKIGLKKEIKSDNTPVTNGDIEVNNILTEKIKSITPDIPIVSEESSINKSNNKLNDFWLIDPIDGTHDYVNNKDEFTLNAGLIINKKPKLGIIYAPAKKRLFYTYGNGSSFELINNKEIKITCEKKTNINQIKAVSYSEKLKPLISDFHNKFGVTNHQKMKSSLKFCVIATGEFDLYVAEPRACEWDIAAGHAILQNAGGIITDFENNEILYGKKDFKNPGLILKRSNNL